MDHYTPDGFHLTDDERDMMSLLDDNELRTRMVESAIELGLRQELPALTQVMGFMFGCLHRANMPYENGRHPHPDEIEMVTTIIGMLLEQFRRAFPHECSLMLMPIVSQDADQLPIMVTIGQGENAEVLWRHSRAANDELNLRDGHRRQMDATILEGDGSIPCNEMWDRLDELCGYHGISLDETDFNQLLGGGE